MTVRTHILQAIVSLCVVVQIGCSRNYNGTWLQNTKDRRAIGQHQQFSVEREATGIRGEAANRIHIKPVHFESPDHIPSVTLANLQPMAGVVAPPQTLVAVSSKSRNRSKRFLYGQLEENHQGMASPMDGTASLRKITFATEGADFDPAVDSTGKWIVYASTQHRNTADLYVKAVDGTTLRQLTDDPANDATPAFSPDGKWIAYASDRSGNWDIYLVSIDGGASRQITLSPNNDIHPSFSPDGKKIVFCTHGSRSGQWELVVIDLDNPATPRFIGHGLFPRWSPTDNRIVYQRAREKSSRYFGIWVLDYINGEGRHPTQIAASANAAAISPNWSSDGQNIVFCTIIDPDSDLQEGTPLQSDIWLVNVDGSGRTNLTRSRFVNLQPSWSPDGTVYFVSNRGQGGMENVWAIGTERAVQAVHTNRESPTFPEEVTVMAEVPMQ